MPSADVLVLGPVTLGGETGPVELPAKLRRLLAILVLSEGRACQVDELVDAIWADTPPPSARKLLRIYVSQLRKLLPSRVSLETTAGAYALRLPASSLDSAEFERLLAAASSAADPTAVAALADEALGLWRGNPYGELAYDDLVHGEAERLEELRLTLIEKRLEALLALGQHERVLAETRPLKSAHPLRERFHALELESLYRSGRQAEALEVYAGFRARLIEEIGLEPSPELRELQRRILNHDPGLLSRSEAGGDGLPASPNPLVGRERELAALGEMLARTHVRLLVLTGAGGSGKTRLALEAARRTAAAFADGAVFVDLAPLSDAAVVPATVARAVGVPEPQGESTGVELAAALQHLELLLVLDNAEHLREAAPLFAELVRHAPHLTLLVTSRAVLHVSGEHVFPVTPLPIDDAAELFRQRAAALQPDVDFGGANAKVVRNICGRVDGLPLAVELAAVRVGTLALDVLLDRLDARLGILTSGPRDLPARQQTLRETIDWSVDLLDEHARRALARFSVFPGSAPADAAEFVCETTLDTVSSLADHNLVQRVVVAGRPRLSLLEVVREYAFELLAADPEELARARGRLADWCVQLAEQAEPELSGDHQIEWLDALEAEHDSFRAVLDDLHHGADYERQLHLSVLLSRFWYVRGYLAEGRRRLRRALEDAEDQPPAARRRASTAAASLALLQGDYEAARGFADEALEAARACEEPEFVANALSNLGAILLAGGHLDAAAETLEEAVRVGRETGNERITALALNNLGDLALTVGDYARAGPLFDESLRLLRKRGDSANIARSLFNVGAVDLMQGQAVRAASRFSESLELSRFAGDKEDIAWSLLGLAAADVDAGGGERAAVLMGAAREVLKQMEAEFKPFERELDRRTEQRCSELLGAGRCADAVARGGLLSLDDATALALAGSAGLVAAAG